MKTLKTLIVGIIGFCSINLSAQTGTIKGQIMNNHHEAVFGAIIKLTQGGVLVTGVSTDFDGKYTIKPLNPGVYEMIVQSSGTHTKQMKGIIVNPDKTSYVDLKVTTNDIEEIPVIAEYQPPIVDKNFVDMESINSEEFLHMAVDRGDIKAAITNVSTEVTIDNNGDIHVRGGRGDATAYIVDGVRSENISGVAALSVENISVITGGIPAQYGDATSGFIVVTTKDYFSGIRSKRIRENYATENYKQKMREKKAKEEEQKRKKEIEEEIKKEEEENSNKG